MHGILCMNIHTVYVHSARVYWFNATWFSDLGVAAPTAVRRGSCLSGIFGIFISGVFNG